MCLLFDAFRSRSHRPPRSCVGGAFGTAAARARAVRIARPAPTLRLRCAQNRIPHRSRGRSPDCPGPPAGNSLRFRSPRNSPSAQPAAACHTARPRCDRLECRRNRSRSGIGLIHQAASVPLRSCWMESCLCHRRLDVSAPSSAADGKLLSAGPPAPVPDATWLETEWQPVCRTALCAETVQHIVAASNAIESR